MSSQSCQFAPLIHKSIERMDPMEVCSIPASTEPRISSDRSMLFDVGKCPLLTQ